MAAITYAELIGQIAARLGRYDLNPDALGRYVIKEFCVDRIDYWKKECLYTGQVVDETITTVAGTREYTVPAGWEEVNAVAYKNGNNWIPLDRVPFENVVAGDTQSPSIRSVPTIWCLRNDQLRLGLGAPDGAYSIQLVMNVPDGPPALESGSNFWTADGKSLVINGVAAEIAGTYMNDPIREGRFRPLEDRDLRALQAKTIRQRGGIQIRPYN